MAELEKTRSFEERMKERIRESIGELLTDKELATMIHRSMEEIFFAERTVQDGYYGHTKIPPLIHTIVRELVDARVKGSVESWLSSHPEEITSRIESALQGGAGVAVMNAIREMFASQFISLQESIKNSLGNSGAGG